MAYRFSDISDIGKYRHFFKYRISYRMEIANFKILDIGYRQIRISVDRGQLKISDIGYRLKPNIGYRISAAIQPICHPWFSLRWNDLTCCLSAECLCVKLPTLKLTIWHGQIYRSIQSHILLSLRSTLSSNYNTLLANLVQVRSHFHFGH